MGDQSLYEEDILIWSEQQAAALRKLAARRDLPNELDLANVIEEIEDVGRSEFHTVESLTDNIMAHLLLLAADPDARSVRGWMTEITAWEVTLQRRISPSMRARLDMASVWRNGLKVAAAKLAEWDEGKAAAVSGLAAMPCPFTAADFAADPLDVPAATARIRKLLPATSR